METKLKIRGNWNELKAKLQKKYPKLTDEDLQYTKGNEDGLVSCISDRLNKSEEEVSEIIDDLQMEKSKTETHPKGGSHQKETSKKHK